MEQFSQARILAVQLVSGTVGEDVFRNALAVYWTNSSPKTLSEQPRPGAPRQNAPRPTITADLRRPVCGCGENNSSDTVVSISSARAPGTICIIPDYCKSPSTNQVFALRYNCVSFTSLFLIFAIAATMSCDLRHSDDLAFSRRETPRPAGAFFNQRASAFSIALKSAHRRSAAATGGDAAKTLDG